MNHTEKFAKLYGNVNMSCLSNGYNKDYQAIDFAFKTTCDAFNEENTLLAMAKAMSDAPDNISEEFLQYYNIKKEEYAKSIIVAKKAMLDINQYASHYGVEKIFDINEASTPTEVMSEVNELVNEFDYYKALAEKITGSIEKDVAMIEMGDGIEYSETKMNISWDDIAAAYTEEELSDKTEGYQDYEYDPETGEEKETIKDPDDLSL